MNMRTTVARRKRTKDKEGGKRGEEVGRGDGNYSVQQIELSFYKLAWKK